MNITPCFVLSASVLLLAACDRTPPTAVTAPAAVPPAAAADPLDPTGGLAPPLIVPGENTPEQPPSYEVSIAAAAADHNKALERCTQQPEAVRTQCEQEANAAFADAQQSLETLRGNPE